MQFKNDAFLWYNVGDWARLGLAVPNFGNDVASQNGSISYLVDAVGRNLQAVMFHSDSRLTVPPSINTLRRVHKLAIRARDILGSRAIDPATPNMESAHNVPAAEVFRVYPVPYFTVRNRWLREWCSFALLALSEAMQHTENAKPIEISTTFAGQVGQYFHRLYRMMAVELLGVPVAEASALDFTLSDAQFAAYDPTKFFTSTELIDTVSPHGETPTEDDLLPLTSGIPVTQLPTLGGWPANGTPGGLGTPATPSGSTAGTTAFVAPQNA